MKMVVEDQHGHVTAGAVADFVNAPDLLDHRRAQARVEIVELSSVRPRSEIGVSSIGNHFSAA